MLKICKTSLMEEEVKFFFGAYGRFGAGLISMQINTGLYFFEFAWLIFLYAMYIK